MNAESWITINAELYKMHSAARLACMVIARDLTDICSRLEVFGELESHSITDSPTGIIVARQGSSHGPSYVQHAWTWPK
ncbi:hypothetical protein KC960_01080 [Candidatus Saccharibacteria bacterium]|nr:hypothetical protein [Candidatus Saccharibacteria bacterium]